MRTMKDRHVDAEDLAVDNAPVRDAADSRCGIHGPPRTGDGPLHDPCSPRDHKNRKPETQTDDLVENPEFLNS